jgi:hypothetical protein
MNFRQAHLKFVSVTVFSLLTAWITEPARANHLDFTVYNETSNPIQALYVSAARSSNWGQDILGRDVLYGGNSTRVTFPGQSPNSPCIYDIRAVFADNSTSEGRFNLCTIDYVNIR